MFGLSNASADGHLPRRFTSTGLVALNRATIEGRLRFTGGSFECSHPCPADEGGHAIEAISATVRGNAGLGWKEVTPSVDFTDLTTSFLAGDPTTWPPPFTIAGMTCGRFERPQGALSGPAWAGGCADMRAAGAGIPRSVTTPAPSVPIPLRHPRATADGT